MLNAANYSLDYSTRSLTKSRRRWLTKAASLVTFTNSNNWFSSNLSANSLSINTSSLKDAEEELETIRQSANLPALATGMIRKDGDCKFAFSGVRNSNSEASLRPNDVFHLGSCTKSMTATLLAIFVQEGKLSWESTLGELFHGIKANNPAKNLNASLTLDQSPWADVTISEVMRHQGGLPANAPWSFWIDRKDIVKAREEVAGWLLTQDKPEDSKRKFLYSNVGYMLIGHALERIEKKPWEEIIRERLFGPLDMKSAGFSSPALLPNNII